MTNLREWGKCRNCGANYKRRREERMALCVPCVRIRLRDPELFDNALRKKEARKRMIRGGLDRISRIPGHWNR